MQELLRFQGNRGTTISPHRSIATIPLAAHDVVIAAAMSLGFSGGLVALFVPIGDLWTALFNELARPLGLSGVAVSVVQFGSALPIALPHFAATAAPPSNTVWWTTLIASVVVLLLSLAMRGPLLPFAYLLRLVVFIQGTALLFFRVRAWDFPYDLPGYVTSMLTCGLITLALVPLVLGLTFYLIDVGLLQKIGLTVAVCGHLALFIPLQYALQTYMIAHGSLLFLPICFTLLGLLPQVLIFIALYGWGMSWPARGRRGMRE